MTDRYLVTLIHGTFAPEAEWTRDDSKSGFKKKLAERLGGDVEFERLEWGGKNRQADRIRWGQIFAESLSRPDLLKKERKHYVICHSHGGNVALYATADNKLEENISGIVCMNTPFMCALPRNFRPLFFALIAVVLWVLGVISEQLGGMLWFTDWEWYIKLLMSLLLIPISLLVTFGLWMLLFSASDLVKALSKKRDEIINEINLPNTRIPLLSIWTGGDEISFAFSIASGFGNLPFLLLYWPVVIISVFALMVGVTLDWLPGLNLFHVEPESWFSTLAAWSDTYIFDPMLTASAYFLVLVMSFVVIALVVNLLLCVLPYGFGIRHVISPLWIRFFTTPVPIQARHTEFKSIDPAAFGLSHSVVYELDSVIDTIVEWMRKEK